MARLLVWPMHRLFMPKNSPPVRIRHFSEPSWFSRFKQQAEVGLTCLRPEPCVTLCDQPHFLPLHLLGTSVLKCSDSRVFVGRSEQRQVLYPPQGCQSAGGLPLRPQPLLLHDGAAHGPAPAAAVTVRVPRCPRAQAAHLCECPGEKGVMMPLSDFRGPNTERNVPEAQRGGAAPVCSQPEWVCFRFPVTLWTGRGLAELTQRPFSLGYTGPATAPHRCG